MIDTDGEDRIPAAKGVIPYTHRLETTHKVTGRKRNLYFYPLDNLQEISKFQPDIDANDLGDVIWGASVDKVWLEYLNAIFVNAWIEQEGIKYNYPKHKSATIEFSKRGLRIRYYGENGNFGKDKQFEVTSVWPNSKNCHLTFATKDLIPVLNGLCKMDVIGSMDIKAYHGSMHFIFKTELGKYEIAVPIADFKGKRIKKGFGAYREAV